MRSEAARLWYTYRMKAVLFSAYKRRGMTLTEVLIAVGVIGVLASVVLVTVNPKQNLEDADDVKRQQDLRVMIDALYQYQIDHGTFPVVQNVYTIDVTHLETLAADESRGRYGVCRCPDNQQFNVQTSRCR